jgi:hypothetical protein
MAAPEVKRRRTTQSSTTTAPGNRSCVDLAPLPALLSLREDKAEGLEMEHGAEEERGRNTLFQRSSLERGECDNAKVSRWLSLPPSPPPGPPPLAP